ncbi:MAG TPA: hypothetical protein PL188_07125 [Candidatus Cloacimonadota bacterium]|nr:hypothetical protein [Candidatus Cloacimonadota bacterium]
MSIRTKTVTPIDYRFINLVMLYIPIQIAWDFVSSYFGSKSESLAIYRGLMSALLMGWFLLKTNFEDRVVRSIWWFCIYVSVLIFTSSNTIYSLNYSSKVFFSMLSFVVGYSFINSDLVFSRLCKSLFYAVLLLILSYGLADILGFGRRAYSRDVELSTTTSWFTYTFVVLLAPLFYYYEKSRIRRLMFHIMMIALLILIGISFKRAAVGGVVLGYAVFFVSWGKLMKSLRYLVLVIPILYLALSQFSGVIGLQYEARSSRFEEGALDTEMRYLETPMVWNQVFSFEDPARSLFGLEAFFTSGLYGGRAFGSRMLHVDFNVILFSTGIVGLLLYMKIYIELVRKKRRVAMRVHYKDYQVSHAVFWSLYVTSLFASISGGIGSLTFRTILFMFMGALLRRMEVLKFEYWSMPSELVTHNKGVSFGIPISQSMTHPEKSFVAQKRN